MTIDFRPCQELEDGFCAPGWGRLYVAGPAPSPATRANTATLMLNTDFDLSSPAPGRGLGFVSFQQDELDQPTQQFQAHIAHIAPRIKLRYRHADHLG